MDIHIIQHSQTRQFHAPDADVATDVLPVAVRAMANLGIDATHYLTHDNQIVEIPVAVRPLAPSRQ